MDAKTGQLRRWGMGICGMSLVLAGTGCTTMIAYSGIVGPQELHAPANRTQVRQRFGTPSAAESRADGTSVETFHIRRRITSTVKALGGDLHSFLFTYGLVEALATPVALYHSEKAKLPVAFVYGADDRIMCHYRVEAPPGSRFEDTTLPLAASLWVQLEGGACPNWSTCVTSFVEQVRMRAACVGYTLSLAEEENLTRLLTIAKHADESRITKVETLAEIQKCLACNDATASCLPPDSSPSDPSLVERPSQKESSAGPV